MKQPNSKANLTPSCEAAMLLTFCFDKLESV